MFQKNKLYYPKFIIYETKDSFFLILIDTYFYPCSFDSEEGFYSPLKFIILFLSSSSGILVVFEFLPYSSLDGCLVVMVVVLL